MAPNKTLPLNFRKLTVSERKRVVCDFFNFSDQDCALLLGKADLSELSDVLIENSIGTFSLPFGLATGFLIDNKEYIIPMAIEEASVVAAATHGAMLAKGGGGIYTSASSSIMTAQIYLHRYTSTAKETILKNEAIIKERVDALVPNLRKREGGYRGMEIEEIKATKHLCISIHIDVRDAMGANLANTAAEGVANLIHQITGCNVLMAILTNASEHRTAKAWFQIPEKYFRRASNTGEEVCKRIVEANELARHYSKRAVTHNKGIMNGISALALATGNDTRAIEAAAHFHAQKQGKYEALTVYEYQDGMLKGSLELPLPLGTVGGSISVWPQAQFALKILGNPSSQELARIGAALGLAQNLSALFALVTEGIQKGHMKLHAAKIAYGAGARGSQIRLLAAKLSAQNSMDPTLAKKLLEDLE